MVRKVCKVFMVCGQRCHRLFQCAIRDFYEMGGVSTGQYNGLCVAGLKPIMELFGKEPLVASIANRIHGGQPYGTVISMVYAPANLQFTGPSDYDVRVETTNLIGDGFA